VRGISAELAIAMPDTSPGGTAWSNLLLAALALLAVTVLVNVVAEGVRARLRRQLGRAAA
jgi:ABC-type uncharacterized transport system permease subunit